MEYKWGILGAGRFADNVFAPAIHQAQNARLVAVMARDKTKAEAFAQKHNAVKSFDSTEALCKEDDVDFVYISSPTILHCGHTVTAAKHGKHILCEKPMAPTLEECDKMIEVCKENKVTLAIGHNMRFHKVHQKVKEMVVNQQVGTVGMVRAEMITSFKKNQGDRFTTDQFRLNRSIGGGGVMFDMGIHTIDVLRYILDDEIEEITGFSQNLFIECDGEDTVSAVFRFKKGVYGSIATSGALPYSRNGVDIHGDKGAIFTDGSVWITARSGEIKLFADDKWVTHTTEINNCYIAEIEHFQECVEKKSKPAVDGEEGKKNVQVVLCIYRSMDEGQPIKIGA